MNVSVYVHVHACIHSSSPLDIHILDAVIFMHVFHAVIFMHVLDAVTFMHGLAAVTFMHISDAAVFIDIRCCNIDAYIRCYTIYAYIMCCNIHANTYGSFLTLNCPCCVKQVLSICSGVACLMCSFVCGMCGF